MKDYEIIPHTADIKIRVYGSTLKQLFKNALVGMFQSIRPIVANCKYKDECLVCPELPEKRKFEIQSSDLDSLLVDFLSEALYLSDINNEAYLDVDIEEISENDIKAILHGIKVEGFEVVEIKAVTYHDLNIKKIDGLWQTNILFDI